MIKIRPHPDRESEVFFAGSIYKSLSEYMAGNPVKIEITPNMNLKDVADSLYAVAEIIASGANIFSKKDDDPIYDIDPDDPADNWKNG